MGILSVSEHVYEIPAVIWQLHLFPEIKKESNIEHRDMLLQKKNMSFVRKS